MSSLFAFGQNATRIEFQERGGRKNLLSNCLDLALVWGTALKFLEWNKRYFQENCLCELLFRSGRGLADPLAANWGFYSYYDNDDNNNNNDDDDNNDNNDDDDNNNNIVNPESGLKRKGFFKEPHDVKSDDDGKILDRLTGANCGNTAFSRQMLSLWKLYATTVVAKHSAAVAHFCLEN